jgi:hypothetical protein
MTDALMSLATAGLYAAKWTTRIETEWIAALEERRPELVGRLDFRRDQMREAIPDWEVPEAAWRACAGGLRLPDLDDVHVLAAALAGHADCIVTTNLKDFPIEAVGPLGVEIIHPYQIHRRAMGSRSARGGRGIQAHAFEVEEAAGDGRGFRDRAGTLRVVGDGATSA